MKLYKNPPQSEWDNLVKRPVLDSENLEELVKQIIDEVKISGDKALKNFALKFDKVNLENLIVSQTEIESASGKIYSELKTAISIAAANIKKFHLSQINSELSVETMKGVSCWRKSVPIENVGLYIPGGSAPLFSTILMLGIPAQIAGCKRIILCTPCDENGQINPAILYTATNLGITEIYKIGGAQAIAAMAYGTECIPKVDKIFGPGNQYVTKAKELVQKNGIAIDLPAGPSEVLVIADENADADFIASDLLSQAEHGADSQVILLTDDISMPEKIKYSLNGQLKILPRENIAQKAIENSFVVVFDSIDRCFEFSNLYAPEHLILAIENAENYIAQIQNAGSVFLGNYTCESAGDYASGTNHTLPTNGYAKSHSGVSLDSFVKKITFQKITKEGLQSIGQTIEVMAEAEQLLAHKNAVSIRLKKINNE
ncbi:histidinol dehydrogenase [Moheibacter sediminis]|uniref:Histidinol dehydrogenase n=1 Tax=Moheibacter sediminis TaxID=1434700 RepID=A0A1W1ZBS2_9FLAO|nr:histidinol dehydrogenase [Moheibacter sediminis]SMC45879.1 histidinol dehydrogenase [Moheibacter sediminis]